MKMNILANAKSRIYVSNCGKFLLVFNPDVTASPVLFDKKYKHLINRCCRSANKLNAKDLYCLMPPNTSEEENKNCVELFEKLGLASSSPKKNIKSCNHISKSVWLHITNNCNLACSYCFVHKTNKSATKEVLSHFVLAMFKEHRKGQLDNLSIKFSGGEPLLRKDLIQYVANKFDTLKKCSELKVSYTILSNGTLIDKSVIRLMKRYNMGIGISMDGIGAIHDSVRMFRNGNGSFNTIAKNVKILKRNNIPLSIMSTLGEGTIEELPLLTKWLLDNQLRSRYSFVKYDNYSNADFLRYCKKIVHAFNKSIEVIKKHPYGPDFVLPWEISELSFKNPLKRQPCGISENYFAVGCKGELGLCPSLLEKPIGNVNRSLTTQLEKHKKKYIDSDEISRKCSTCQWYKVCATGCPQLNEKLYGHCNAPSPFCCAYKKLIPLYIQTYGWALSALYKRSNNMNHEKN